MAELHLNIAATCVGTNTLGPGYRSVVWVQGCPLNCVGCVSPDWIPQKTNRLVSPGELADELLARPGISGITISGGEPMLQARGLIQLILGMKRKQPLNVICFTGYLFEKLTAHPPNPFVGEFLALIDLLVDGPYVERLNDNRGMRGSTNQRFIHLTNALGQHDFAGQRRRIEYQVMDGQLVMVGVPPRQVHQIIDAKVGAFDPKEASYVRP